MADVRTLLLRGRIRVAIDPEDLPAAEFHGTDWNRISGMLLGAAIGDSLGNTSESQLPSERRATHGEIRDYLPNRHAGGLRVGLPSDDTQLAFRTLEHLLENGGVLDPQLLAQKLASGPIFGLGSTVFAFLMERRQGGHWIDSAQESAGNGALMRIAPVLLPHLGSPGPSLWRDAVIASAVTHNDFASNASCAAFVAVLFEALQATPPVRPLFWLKRFVRIAAALEGDEPRYTPRAPRYAAVPVSLAGFTDEFVQRALNTGASTIDACDDWYSGAFLLETVPSVLYILERHGNDPEEAIVRAVNDTRDNDTIAAIVGAAVGALHGADALPKRWREGLLGRTGEADDGRLFELIDRARGSPNESPDWLSRYVHDAVRKGLCTKVGCTTCGSMEFRSGWRFAFNWASRYCAGESAERLRALATALARIRPEDDGRDRRIESAVRLLLFEMQAEGWLWSPEFRRVLEGSWVGSILEQMRAHCRADRELAADHETRQRELQAASAEKRRERQERHQARLAAKVEKDRLWRATHDVSSSTKPPESSN